MGFLCVQVSVSPCAPWAFSVSLFALLVLYFETYLVSNEKERERVHLGGWGCGEDLGVWETAIRKHCMKKPIINEN